MSNTRNPNRGVILRLDDAAAIHRMLELYLNGRRFDNPIVAHETKHAAEEATERLGRKLLDIFEAHQNRDASEIYV